MCAPTLQTVWFSHTMPLKLKAWNRSTVPLTVYVSRHKLMLSASQILITQKWRENSNQHDQGQHGFCMDFLPHRVQKAHRSFFSPGFAHGPCNCQVFTYLGTLYKGSVETQYIISPATLKTRKLPAQLQAWFEETSTYSTWIHNVDVNSVRLVIISHILLLYFLLPGKLGVTRVYLIFWGRLLLCLYDAMVG